jgi:DNA-binding beta-propeller fold protein YncE
LRVAGESRARAILPAYKGVGGCFVEIYTQISSEGFPFAQSGEYVVYANYAVWPACSQLSTSICHRTNLLVNAEEDLAEFGISVGAAPDFLAKWGSQGAAAGQFESPGDIAVDAYGNSYVVDTENHRVQKFDSNGGFVAEWGVAGVGEGDFYEPRGVAVDNDGYVYVTDANNHRVQKFTSDGDYVTQWGEFGFEAEQFFFPGAIAVGPDGLVYVGDDQERVQKFTRDGTYVSEWGGTGVADGEFVTLNGIAFDEAGDVYVADHDGWRVQKLTSEGVFILKWIYDDPCGGIDFEEPSGIAVLDSVVYVSYPLRHLVRSFTSNGTLLAEWGLEGDRDGWMDTPLGIAANRFTGGVYVVDNGNNRIQVFGETLVGVGPAGLFDGVDVSVYPNPFNPSVTISYLSRNAVVDRISIYDVRGALVRRLPAPQQRAVEGSVTWNGENDAGVTAPSGVYFVVVESSRGMVSRKIVMLK